MHADKIEAMTMNGGKVCPNISGHAYQRKVDGSVSTFLEISKEKIQCKYCGAN
jgi:hypothetical protein